MSVKEFNVKRVQVSEIRDFIVKWHYSKSIKGVNISYAFGLFNGDELIGAIIYGTPAMPSVWKKYVDSKDDIVELRRLCCIDDTPKNTESYFIAKTIKWLKRNTGIKKIVSFSDLTYGHEGIVYRASNFTKVGETPSSRVIVDNDGKIYHERTLRSKENGVVKPIAMRLAYMLDRGLARYEKTKKKNVYLYEVSK